MSKLPIADDESDERRGLGRRQEDLPVAEDRRSDERRSVPGIADLFDHLRRGNLNIGTPPEE